MAKARVGRKPRENRGAKHCNNSFCPSQGRFQHRDVMAAMNIACIFVLRMVLGGYLGSFSRCEELKADGTQMADTTQCLSLLNVFRG